MDNNTNTPIEKLKIEVNESLTLTYAYINNAISLIEKLSESFYQNPDDKTWNTLIDLFEGMEWILTTMDQIDSIKNLEQIVNDHSTWNEYVKEVNELMEMIKEMEEAVVSEDNISIGDILMYEIVPIFKNMKSKLEFLKPRGDNLNVN